MIPLEREPAPGIVPGYTWQPGDRLARIGSTPLRDILDFYYLSEDEGDVEVVVVDAVDKPTIFQIDTDHLPVLAETFAPMEFKTCACECVFCFIDQNPQGLRQNLYVKDEDFRLSFLYGNYITLTSLGKNGIRRIIEQRLTPLYVSVHATEPQTRARMLGIKRQMDVAGVLKQLTAGGITVHAQIVLCPGWNDGNVLQRSLEDLGALYPGVESIAVVPVGLSDHREGLTELRPVTRADALATIEQVSRWSDAFLGQHDTRLAFVSDEFFLRAGLPFPSLSTYDDLPQEDNGIGMARSMIEEVRDALPLLGDLTEERRTATIVTGTLAAEFFRRDILPLLGAVPWLDLRVVGVTNTLYGSGITVAGLLSGNDLLASIQGLPEDAGHVLMPESPVNHDGIFLDDLPLDDLLRQAGRPVHVAREGLVDTLLALGNGSLGEES